MSSPSSSQDNDAQLQVLDGQTVDDNENDPTTNRDIEHSIIINEDRDAKSAADSNTATYPTDSPILNSGGRKNDATWNRPDPCANKESNQGSHLSPIIRIFRTIFSGAFFIFSIFLLITSTFQKQTKATVAGGYEIRPVVAFIVALVALTWLALMEGGLNSMIGLVPVQPSLYQQSHKRTYLCTKIAHKDGNVERFIIGRQYLDLMCVFTTNFMLNSIKHPIIHGIPQIVTNIFFKSGIAVIMVTIIYGQLSTQINSSKFMLDSMNNPAMVITTYAALLVESSGIVHATYFFRMVVEKIGGITKPKGEGKTVLFWIQVVLSVCLLCLSFAILFTALFQGKTTSWDRVPPYLSTIIFILVVLLVGMMDGLQIALMAAIRMPIETIDAFPIAKRNCDVVFRGNNLEAFLVGRQMFQTIIQFSIARMISFDPSVKDNIFGVSDGIQKVLNAGVLGVLITTIVASLAWRVVANAFPLAFLSHRASRPIIWLCFFAEGTGLGDISWVMAYGYEKMFGLKHDNHYLGSSSYYAADAATALSNSNPKDDSAAETTADSESTPSVNDEQV
jgi:Silicon transporter